MPPENGGGAPQAGDPAQPQAGSTAGGQEPPAATGQAPAAEAQPSGETAEEKAARLEAENTTLRRENAERRRTNTTLQQQAENAANAGKSELEIAQQAAKTLQDQNTQLAAQVREQAVRSEAVTVATRLKFRSPDLAYRLLDHGTLEFDDTTGAPKNIEAQLKAILAAEPYLGSAAGADFGGGNRGQQPGSGEPGMNELLKAALGRG